MSSFCSAEPPLPPTDLECSAAGYNCSTASILCSWREPRGNMPPISYNISAGGDPHQVLMETNITIVLDCEQTERTAVVVTTDGCGLSSINSVGDIVLSIGKLYYLQYTLMPTLI